VLQKIRVDLFREKKARERLKQFNDELEEQVRIKTADLQASEEKYKNIFYKSPLPKLIYEVDTRQFMEVNDAAVGHYGYRQEEFLKLRLDDLLPEDELDRLMEVMREIVNNVSEKARHSYWRQIKKNGEFMYAEFTTYPMQYDRRNARMVVVNDITARRQAEGLLQEASEKLEKRAAELASSNGELERFAYVASHDLQEPLRMVSSFLQLLQKRYKGQLDEKADQYIHFAVDGAERMKILIMDLLEYSRVGSTKESRVPVRMREAAEEVVAVFREKIVTADARVEIGDLPVIAAEKVQMVQLLQNLIGNALKYRSETPPLIRVGSRELPEHWEFTVEDNGIGIDPAFREKIFVIFQRLHNRSEYSGTGIGLAICKKIVERHGGQIRVDSEPGRGSAFVFTIGKFL
jgi:PAS domain S-box-containing protein